MWWASLAMITEMRIVGWKTTVLSMTRARVISHRAGVSRARGNSGPVAGPLRTGFPAGSYGALRRCVRSPSFPQSPGRSRSSPSHLHLAIDARLAQQSEPLNLSAAEDFGFQLQPLTQLRIRLMPANRPEVQEALAQIAFDSRTIAHPQAPIGSITDLASVLPATSIVSLATKPRP